MRRPVRGLLPPDTTRSRSACVHGADDEGVDVYQAARLVLHHPDDAETLAQDAAELLPGDGSKAAGGSVVGGREVVAVRASSSGRPRAGSPSPCRGRSGTRGPGPACRPCAAGSGPGRRRSRGAVRVTKVADSGRPFRVRSARANEGTGVGGVSAEQTGHCERGGLPQRRSTDLRPSTSPVEASNLGNGQLDGPEAGPWVLLWGVRWRAPPGQSGDTLPAPGAVSSAHPGWPTTGAGDSLHRVGEAVIPGFVVHLPERDGDFVDRVLAASARRWGPQPSKSLLAKPSRWAST